MHTTTQHNMHTHTHKNTQTNRGTLPWFHSPITSHNLPADLLDLLPQWRCDQIYSGHSNSKTLLLEGQKRETWEKVSHTEVSMTHSVKVLKYSTCMRRKIHQYTLPLLSSPQKSTGNKSQLNSKQSSNGPSPVNLLTIGGYFKCYMYCVMVLGYSWRKKDRKKKRKKKERKLHVEQFRLSIISGLPLSK